MRVYVAGRLTDYRRVRTMQAAVEMHGHTITHDWTRFEAEFDSEDRSHEVMQQRAMDDMRGVVTANLVIALGHPEVHGTLWELGAACAILLQTWLVDWDLVGRKSVFTHMPNITTMDFPEAVHRLRHA